MSEEISIGIAGYGNLGRGVEVALTKNPGMTLAGVFTRRDPGSISTALPETRVFGWSALPDHADAIDVLMLCGGSKEDLPRRQLASAVSIPREASTRLDRGLTHHLSPDPDFPSCR